MNGRKIITGIDFLTHTRAACIAVCSLFFLIGIVIGISASGAVVSSDALLFIDSVAQGTGIDRELIPGYFTILFNITLIPALAILFGFSLLGVVVVPACCVLRGLSLSFCVAFIVRALGFSLGAQFYLPFCITALLSVPCFFFAAVQALSSSLGICALVSTGEARSAIFGAGYFVRLIICILSFAMISAAERIILLYYFC